MRRGHRVILAVLGVLMLLEAGCLRRWQNPPADPNYPHDPLFQRRDFPTYPPGAPGAFDPNRPEVLTPQPPPMDPAPNRVMPPNASGYIPFPRGGVVPADHLQILPPYAPPSNQEPPLARATPPDQKQPIRQLPPDLLERKIAQNIAPAGVPETAPGSPVGITLFSEVKEKAMATGLKPDLEGLDWLKASKYRAVIHLRRAGVDDSADREQVERRGLKYFSIELSPDTLTRDAVTLFGKIAGDRENQPVFVYDRDGLLAGAMWYLHLRLNEKIPDELARGRAELYGLKEKGTDEATALWAAVQKLLQLPMSFGF